jgi:hypothetical protein
MISDVKRFQFSFGTIPCDKLKHLSQLRNVSSLCFCLLHPRVSLLCFNAWHSQFPSYFSVCSAFFSWKYHHEIFIWLEIVVVARFGVKETLLWVLASKCYSTQEISVCFSTPFEVWDTARVNSLFNRQLFFLFHGEPHWEIVEMARKPKKAFCWC